MRQFRAAEATRTVANWLRSAQQTICVNRATAGPMSHLHRCPRAHGHAWRAELHRHGTMTSRYDGSCGENWKTHRLLSNGAVCRTCCPHGRHSLQKLSPSPEHEGHAVASGLSEFGTKQLGPFAADLQEWGTAGPSAGRCTASRAEWHHWY